MENDLGEREREIRTFFSIRNSFKVSKLAYSLAKVVN